MTNMRLHSASERAALRLALLSLGVVFAASPVLARDADRATPSFSAEAIQAQINYLASNELRGRESGTPGNETAARFIAAEFKKYGLKPIGAGKQKDETAKADGSGYFQPFRFLAGRAIGKNSLLEVTLNGKAERFRANQDFEPSAVSESGKAEGSLVFAGYGIHAPQENHDDYAGLDVKGKVVLLLAGGPTNLPDRLSNIYKKAIDARDLGASAVLVVLPKNSDVQGNGAPGLGDPASASIPVLRVKYVLAEEWLKAAGKDLGTLQMNANDQQIVSADLNIPARVAADVRKIERVSANIVGLIEGSDPVLKKEYVVIGAHMDHLGMGGPGSLDRSGKPAIHPGADDNASGTSGILQLAAAFGKPAGSPGVPTSPFKRSVVLICFSGEEKGLLGSAHYTQDPILPLDKTVAMLNMDMVGRLRDDKLVIIGSGTAKEWPELLQETNRETGFKLSFNESGFGGSDHQSFYLKNIPVLFFFTDTHKEYHTPQDTADTVNSAGEARVLRMVAACAEKIADAPERPTFQQVKTADRNAPSRGFRVYFGSIPDYASNVEGVLLNGTREGSPAEKAGLKAGDILIKFGEKTVKNIQDYALALQDYKPGDTVHVVVKRGDRTLTLVVTLEARKE